MRTIFHVLRDAHRLGIQSRHGLILMALQLAASVFELLGLVSFVPVLQFLMAKGDIAKLALENTHWQQLTSLAGKLAIPVTLPVLLLGTFALFALRQAMTLARDLFDYVTRENATSRLRSLVLSQHLQASVDYQDRATTGGIVADINLNLQRAVTHIYGRFGLIVQLILCAVYLGGMVIIDATMTAFLLGVMALSGALVFPLLLRSRRIGRDFVKAGNRMSEYLLERLALARLVRLSRMEAAESRAFDALSRRVRDVAVRSWLLLAAVDKLLESVALVAGLLVIYVASTFFNVGVEIVGLFLAMLLRLMPVVRQITATKQAVDTYRGSYDAILFRLQEAAANREPATGTRGMQYLVSDFRLSDVSFTYPSRSTSPVLRGVSLIFPARKMTAVVGPSGSGKSTLVDLLPRLRTPSHGRITVGDVDLGEVELQSLRRHIAYLSQKPLIFNVPLKAHIAYGTEAAAPTEIERAARLAGIHEGIAALPEGYDTLAGEGGNRLSGGQRQRLDLARALLSRAPVLILDEPTASLDGESAAELHRALDRIRAETKTTIIIISHHLPSIRGADQIVVLRDGLVEAVGRHEDLMRGDGWYAATWRAQMAEPTAIAATAA
jgi:ABC-type multidrug transport system fused ATPase/permease subunit